MNQPLARSAGNALEVMEAIEFLRVDIVSQTGRRHFVLGQRNVVAGWSGRRIRKRHENVDRVLESGLAAEHFARMVSYAGWAG